MEFRVLGPVEVRVDGEPLEIGGPKAGSLLAALIAHRGEPVSQDRLAEAIWPDSSRSRDTLQSYVSRVRRQLGPRGRRLLLRDGTGYSLDVTGGLDAERFESLVETSADAVSEGDVGEAVARLQEGLDLWRGPAFWEFASDELVRAAATRLEELRLAAREQRIDAEITLGRHAQVIGELEGLCDSHPLRERLWELRMLALARGGRQAEALRAFQRAREVLVEELGIEPSEPLRRMEQMVLTQDPALHLPSESVGRVRGPIEAPVDVNSDSRDPTVNLPPDPTVFIGRDHEVSELVRLLDDTRLLTLTGIGGVGKTRLAIQVARQWASAHSGRVGFVDLSGVMDPSEIEAKLTECLGSLGSASEHDLLVILDNCEHLIERCAEVVGETNQSLPTLRILATSREPLRLPGETRWRVEPMEVPDAEASSADLADTDAARLFIERSLAIRPGMEFDETGLTDVGRICRWLDGIPLAIELSAALVGTMGLREIEQGQASRFELLREGYRTSPARQQTLASAFDWSYELLDEDEKRLLQQLSHSAIEFSRRAAEVICADDPSEEPSIGARLGRLVDRSLVQMDERSGHATYSIFPSIRQFIGEKTGWASNFPANRAFVVQLAQHTEPRLRGTVDEMWSALLDGSTDVARATIDLTFFLHDVEAGCFLAGVVAAHATSSGRIAFVGGVRARYIARFESGFRAGARHARDDVEVDAVYLSEPPDFSGFMDVGRARRVGTEAFQRGADIVFHAAGDQGGQGVFEAARQWHESTGDKRWVIGVDRDERVTRDASLRRYALTSMRRQIPTSEYLEIKAAVADGMPERAPVLDLANEGVGLSTTGGAIDHLASELEAVREGLAAGNIEIPRATTRDGRWWTDPAIDG